MIANNPRLADVGSAANRRRASEAGRRQAALARQALAALKAQTPTVAHQQRWMRALQHRVDNPDSALAELGQTMTPPMSKHAYAALLRRALRGGGVTDGGGQPPQSPAEVYTAPRRGHRSTYDCRRTSCALPEGISTRCRAEPAAIIPQIPISERTVLCQQKLASPLALHQRARHTRATPGGS